MVMEVVFEDMGEGSVQCVNHRYKNGTPGGICAYCLQEKLGKLVSSSFAATVFPSSSRSSSTPSRSEFDGGATSSGGRTAAAAAASLQSRHLPSSSTNSGCVYSTKGTNSSNQGYNARRSRLPYYLTRVRQRTAADGAAPPPNDGSIALKRSKSTTTPRRGLQISEENYSEDLSPYKRGFWSFLYSSKHSSVKTSTMHYTDLNFSSATPSTISSNCGVLRSRDQKKDEFLAVDGNCSPDENSFDRKVSRSRSVGCGSRSFSGDFFGRISTGFGDCTLRRVESQREGKPKTPIVDDSKNGSKHYMNERMKCGGIFSGFAISSSASSSSTEENMSRKSLRAPHTSMGLSHGRIKSWGWALTSPMRAFSKPAGKSFTSSNNNTTTNLAAIPSLLAVTR